MSTTTVSVEAENASALLFQTLGAHRTAMAALRPRPSPRLGVGRANDAEQIQCQSTLVRLLSITESFASELLLREVDKVTARARSAAVDSLWDEAAVRGTNSWREQQ